MPQFDLKGALRDRRVTIGSWIQLGHPALAEILAHAGYDWLVVDMEHSDIDLATFTNLARGMFGRRAAPLVRVPENDMLSIRLAFDQGAAGVIVPMVDTPQQAREAVAASKYPPIGRRGFAAPRCNEYGAEAAQYNAEANQRTCVIVMIETKEAVENCREIVAVEGVDGVLIGTFDLSGSLGVTGETEHPRVLQAQRTVLEACTREGKSAGIHVVFPTTDRVRGAVDGGFTFLAVGVDHVFLRERATEALATVKAAVEDKR